MASISKQQTVRDVNDSAPSYMDRFMNFIARLPISYWLTYLGLFIVQSTFIHILAWVDGWIPAFTFKPVLLLFPVWQWAPLAIVTYVGSVSLQALSTFSPLLDVDEIELQKLKEQFTTMPARGVILNSVIWAAVFIILNLFTFEPFRTSYKIDVFLSVVILLQGLIAFMTGSVIYYHSLRQLSLINKTVKLAKQFNMFQLDPVYAFSRVTSLIGVSWMIMLSLTLLVFPIQLVGGLILAILILQVVLAVAAFVLPLWFVHRRLVAEKLKLLAEFNRQVESTSAKLHHSLDTNDMGLVTQLKDALLGLTAEHEILNRIPTWPWSSGTITGFLSATVLPIALFIIQFIIQKLLGR